jgi:hypothetical protein
VNFGPFFGFFARVAGLVIGVSRSGIWVGRRFGPLRVGIDLFRFRR